MLRTKIFKQKHISRLFAPHISPCAGGAAVRRRAGGRWPARVPTGGGGRAAGDPPGGVRGPRRPPAPRAPHSFPIPPLCLTHFPLGRMLGYRRDHGRARGLLAGCARGARLASPEQFLSRKRQTFRFSLVEKIRRIASNDRPFQPRNSCFGRGAHVGQGGAGIATVVEEAAKKLSPPPPPDRRRVNT